MVCIHCGGRTRVANSRAQKRANQVWRRRICTNCGAVFTTQERAQYGSTWAVRGRTGALQPFSRDRLLLSLYGSLRHRKTALADAAGLVNTIVQRLGDAAHQGIIEAATIEHTAQVALSRFDKTAAVHYRAFHGPAA